MDENAIGKVFEMDEIKKVGQWMDEPQEVHKALVFFCFLHNYGISIYVELYELSVVQVAGLCSTEMTWCIVLIQMVVEPASAMQLAGNNFYKLEDCNHTEVCKPVNKDDASYSILVNILKNSRQGTKPDVFRERHV